MPATGVLRNARLINALETVKDKIRKIAGENVLLFVYGSYARGEEREDSDVDLMVVLPDEKADFPTEENIRDTVIDVGLDNDFLFSVIVVSRSQKEKFRGFKVFDSVDREGLLV